MTLKHTKNKNGDINENISHTYKEEPLFCNCGKIYKYRQGLYKHKQTCVTCNEIETNKISPNLILQLVKENKELKEILIEQNKTIIEISKNNKTTNNTYCNNNNKTFNLHLFLNETCKNAMNIMDFVDSIKLQLTDLEKVGNLGFVNGITNIIVKNLKALDETERPVHCTDKKRETIYVKDENKWEKEDNEHKKVRKAIKTIAKNNSKLLFDFKDKYPDCLDSNSKNSDKYTKLMVEAYGGQNKDDFDNENKIIKNISKEVLIDK
jgi:hypothetical protein